jgi:hypothetical protein
MGINFNFNNYFYYFSIINLFFWHLRTILF